MSGCSVVGKVRLVAAVLAAVGVTALSGCAIGFRGPAVGITYNSANLTGDVLSNRSEEGTWWFKYGKTASYGQESTHRFHFFEANVRQGVAHQISGLEPATTYHYSLCAEDQDPAVDALCSGDSTFTTVGDYVRGSVITLSPIGFGVFIFDDVRSGPDGESPVGSMTTLPSSALSGPVTCLRVTGDTKFTVGVASFFLFFDLPLAGAGTVTLESLDGRDPSVCPLDPTGGGTAQAARNTDFSMHDEP